MGKIADTLVDAGHDVVSFYIFIFFAVSFLDCANLGNGCIDDWWNEKGEDRQSFSSRGSESHGQFHSYNLFFKSEFQNTHFMEEGAPPIDIFDKDLYTLFGMIEVVIIFLLFTKAC